MKRLNEDRRVAAGVAKMGKQRTTFQQSSG
jgi:hypothetical protein